MIRFYGCNLVAGKRMLRHAVTVAVAVSMVFVGLFSSSCKRREKPVVHAPAVVESVYTNRNNNVLYVNSLKQNFKVQLSKAAVRREAASKLAARKEQVKATLAAGADEAALERALAADEAWPKLKAALEQAEKDEALSVDDAREKVRQAMLEEIRARKAVASGQAKAVDQSKTN